jgi:predicted acetyltransferase
MEIRPLTLDDLPAAKHILSHAFGHGTPTEIEPERWINPVRTRLGAFENGKLQAVYAIITYEMFFGQSKHPCGGIAGVASDPAARGRGYAGALIDRSLEVMREKGQFLSLLWPFDQRFYRNYGWDWTGYYRTYKAPLSLFKSYTESKDVESVKDNISTLFNPLYEKLASQYNGPLVREERMWEGKMSPWDNRNPAAYLYQKDGKAEGYAIVRYTEDKKLIQASEMVATSISAYKGLLGLLHRHAMTVEQVEWRAPMDDPLWSIIAHWDIETKLIPAAMGRVVDLKAALSARKPEAGVNGTAIIEVEDKHASWNAGKWQVSLESGNVEVKRSDREPGVRLDIQALTQAYWGTPSLEDLLKWERLSVQDEEQFKVLCALLPASNVWLYDDF